MSDMLGTGLSALLAYQTALNTTSHNISNANTEGYSRQRVSLSSVQGTGTGAGYVGAGVQIAQIARISDASTVNLLQGYTSSQSRADTYASYASRLDSLMSDSSLNLATPLSGFFSAANALANNPTSSSVRQAFLAAGDTLASRFNEIQGQLDSLNDEVNNGLSTTVGELNQYTDQLAKLNNQITVAQAQFGGQAPNDLLDQRDQLVKEISSRIGVRTEAQADGSVNVFTTTGQALVLAGDATALGLADDAYHSGNLDITYGGQSITSQISGGAIGGLLDTRRELIQPAQNEIGRLATALAVSVNQQNAAGVDLDGNAGGNLFTVPAVGVLTNTNNTGSATLSASVSSVSALGTSNYVLSYDGSAWSASDARSGASVSLSGSGTLADPLVLGGVSITVGGSAQAGDRFLVQPTTHAAGEIGMATSNARSIAAAAAGSAANSSSNSNAQALAALGAQTLLNGGKDSLSAAQSAMVARIGSQSQQAGIQLDAQTALQSQAQSAWESKSGVNLDEEAADLIRYQQAYQAAARVVQIASDVFQTLLSATKG
ncbi:flagellar hook-associated protein 1 FlgK [Solimonas aquatica]|uniref:Flagellar hook-associated protein 1 n=1 Tax=Solimonas aquatica TaxID=489703 RepID=A0A1H9DZK6_9GAMM|nr:flagellar hook-associated protein FlgK [Solimonas aquatica]SEQ18875.1 flagellar hook-associated protein 1 FlgK [Solimonas aquatica]